MIMRAVICALLISLAPAAWSQSAASSVMFEVVSIKPTPPAQQNQLRTSYCTNGGRFIVAGTPVIWSLAYAYRVKEYQISGAPAWLNQFDSAYDIEGTPPGPVNDEQCRLMAQSLFVDRFRLAVHRESKQSSVYLLTIGKGGMKLHVGNRVKLNGGVQMGASGKPQWPDGWTMSDLAMYLSNYTDRPVVDHTGLNGRYEINLDFSLSDQDNRPSIFTAVQEQLGLKLDAGQAPVEMLIVDHIQKPEPN
jgi:uncharacterized protein (TIGR03435 family)